MTYQDTIDWMFSQLPMYQRQGQKAFKKDLNNIKKLAKHLNHPEEHFKSIHVAGTNGKGSVCHTLASVFQEAGYKTGLYTSPHLKDFRERIRIDGKMISKEEVQKFISVNREFFENNQLSFFEMSVGMAFQYFADKEVDIALIETGLGGRLDSTNIIKPVLSIITNIGWDHMAMLGNTLDKIAFEKAGIIKHGTPVVIGKRQQETQVVFQEKAKALKAPIYFAKQAQELKYPTDLKGNYQKENQQTVLKSIDVLRALGWKISEENVGKGLINVQKNTGLQGRWQILGENPKIICDTAHNKDGLSLVTKQISTLKFEKSHIVIGVVNDKDLSSILPLFPKDATYYFCRPNVPRGLSSKELKQAAEKFDLKGKSYKSVNQALESAKENASDKDLIYIGGSTFTVAEIL